MLTPIRNNCGQVPRDAQSKLETVQLDVLLGDLQGAGQKALHLVTLVALELENVAQLRVLVDVAIAAKLLLERLKNPLQIVLGRDALDSRNGLTTIALLATDVDLVSTLSLGFTSLGKGVEFEVVQGGHKLRDSCWWMCVWYVSFCLRKKGF